MILANMHDIFVRFEIEKKLYKKRKKDNLKSIIKTKLNRFKDLNSSCICCTPIRLK